MAKLKLNLDELRVQSFQTTPNERPQQGTVFAYETPDCGTAYTDCWGTCGEASHMCGTYTCNSDDSRTQECNSQEPACSDCFECTVYGDCTMYDGCTDDDGCTEGICGN